MRDNNTSAAAAACCLESENEATKLTSSSSEAGNASAPFPPPLFFLPYIPVLLLRFPCSKDPGKKDVRFLFDAKNYLAPRRKGLVGLRAEIAFQQFPLYLLLGRFYLSSSFVSLRVFSLFLLAPVSLVDFFVAILLASNY